MAKNHPAVMKKVLIITYYWPPSGGSGVQRWVKFTKYLRSFGWEPIIYTVTDGEFPVLDHSLAKDIPDDVTVIRRPIFEPFSLYKKFTGRNKEDRVQVGIIEQSKRGSLKDRIALWIRSNVFIPDARMFWIRPSVRFLKKYLRENPVQAVISTGPPHSAHLIAMRLKNKLHIPWIADFRDPWTEIYYFKDLDLTAYARERHKTLEHEVLSNADQVLVVGKGMQDGFRKLGVESIVLTNGFDEDDFQDKILKDEIFTFVHTGNLLNYVHVRALWEAVVELKSEGLLKHFEIRLIGKVGDDKVRELSQFPIADHIRFVSYIPHAEITKAQQSAHILILPLESSTPVLTGKFFEYLGSGTDILALGDEVTNFEVKNILSKSPGSIFLNHYDKENIKKYIKSKYENPDVNIPSRPNFENFSRKSLTKTLAGILDDLDIK
jgi:hypothetical protein